MSAFPGSPRVLKGAIVAVDPLSGRLTVIVFQYNPETLTRSLSPQAAGTSAASSKSEALRLQGPPQESIRMEIELDAADQLDKGDPITTSLGLHPTLAALEILLYPFSGLVIANQILEAFGVLEVIPPEAPLTLLVWGAKRIVPIRIQDLSITEEAFDPQLNPIRARVGLNARVLTYDDLGLDSVGGGIFMAHQIIKETMAIIGTANSLSAVSSSLSLPLGGI